MAATGATKSTPPFAEDQWGASRAWALLLLSFAALLAMSQWSYRWTDIAALASPATVPPENLIGPAGAWIAFSLLMTFGVCAHTLPLLLLYPAWLLWFRPQERLWPRFLGVLCLLIAGGLLFDVRHAAWADAAERQNLGPYTGGLIGYGLGRGLLVRYFKGLGAGMLGGVGLAAAFVLYVGPAHVRGLCGGVAALAAQAATRVATAWRARAAQRASGAGAAVAAAPRRATPARATGLSAVTRRPGAEPTPAPAVEAPVSRPIIVAHGTVIDDYGDAADPAGERQLPLGVEVDVDVEAQPPAPRRMPRKPPAAAAATDGDGAEEVVVEVQEGAPRGFAGYQLPPIDLLDRVPERERPAIRADLEVVARVLEETLKEFGIDVRVTEVAQGPVVTRYELLPAAGIRVERIAQLSNNIALALKATNVRIQAPVPGKGVVGIEVPNDRSEVVYLRDTLEGGLATSNAELPLVLGKDVSGNELVVDLARMPHLLIAGATGSGKTVCMNSILCGLLLTRTPEELRLMLVDPKIVEFSAFNDLPHLVVPVITDAKKVAIGLRWAINEMEKRYKLFAKVGVRNIQAYNGRPVEQELFTNLPSKDKPPARVPYIVIVIDELADLMLVAQAEIENCIARLAALSRAVGIHMILATQRPSVNVITGTIKANFPARIAFQVAQKVDSRTILDTVGAERLLGRGDMLYHPPGSSKLVRAQGALVSDEDLHRVIEYARAQAVPEFEIAIKEKIESKVASAEEGGEDELLDQAIEVVRETQRASTSSLQRRLRIGYTRAARLMDIMEERGIVGPPRGSDPREILMDLDAGVPVEAGLPEEE